MIARERLAVRRLELKDVYAVLEIMDDCRCEYSNGPGTLLEDSDDELFERYHNRRSAYFVATVDDEIVGRAGIAPLRDSDGSICELQRMYLRAAHRAHGIGRALLEQGLNAAREFRYCRCYARTFSATLAATIFF